MFHNFYEIVTLVVLGTAVLYCRPIKIMSNPEENNDLFFFCSAITIGMVMVIGRSLEVWWMIEGGEEVGGARRASKRDAVMYSISALWFAAASIYAGVKYYGNDHSNYDAYGSDYDSAYSTGHGDGYGNSTSDGYSYNNTESSVENDNHRVRSLAGDSLHVNEEESSYSGDVSVALLLAGYAAGHLLWFSMIAFYLPNAAGGDFKK
jgi:hypothetical protein